MTLQTDGYSAIVYLVKEEGFMSKDKGRKETKKPKKAKVTP